MFRRPEIVFVHAERRVYAKLDEDVVLDPSVSSDPGSIKNILWKHENDLAMEWDSQSEEVIRYRHFQGKLTSHCFWCGIRY